MNRKYRNLEERLIANTVIDPACFVVIAGEKDYCWIWTGARSNRDYGKITVREAGILKTWLAHRLAFSIFKGIRLMSNLVICHTCDNPLCINPAHLRQGKQTTNVRDCVAKGRHISGFERVRGIYDNARRGLR